MKDFFVKNKQVFLFVSALIVLVVVGLAFYMYRGANVPRKVAKVKGEIALVEGAVEYKKANGEWVAGATGLLVEEGYSVKTGANGRAIVNLDDNSAVRLNSNTQVTLTRLDSTEMVITNDAGDVYTRVAKLDRKFTVKTDVVSAESLGTAYRTVKTDANDTIDVFESKVRIRVKADSEDVNEGNKYVFDKNKSTKLVSALVKTDLGKDGFVLWNKTQDGNAEQYKNKLGYLTDVVEYKEPEKPVETPAPAVVTPTAKIWLSASADASGVNMSWSVVGVDVSKGFKLVRSTSAYPVYPGNDYIYLSESGARNYHWDITDGQTYHLRVCQYLGGSCGMYSNDVTVRAPFVATGPAVSAISLVSSGLVGSENGVSWTTTGYSSKGFKVVWSKTSGPTYPTRATDQYHYYSSPTTTTDALAAFDGPGTYYVRVCEYLGGACGLYSNEITVTF